LLGLPGQFRKAQKMVSLCSHLSNNGKGKNIILMLMGRPAMRLSMPPTRLKA